MNKTNLPPAAVAALEQTIARGDLAHYAAAEAITRLHENWDDALGGPTPMNALIPDIDDVIAALQEHKASLSAAFPIDI